MFGNSIESKRVAGPPLSKKWDMGKSSSKKIKKRWNKDSSVNSSSKNTIIEEDEEKGTKLISHYSTDVSPDNRSTQPPNLQKTLGKRSFDEIEKNGVSQNVMVDSTENDNIKESKANTKKKKKKRKKNKKSKNSDIIVEQNDDETQKKATDTEISSLFPYPAEEDDHCESPLEAYQHIAPLLRKVATFMGKTPQTLSIYDPYYCDGSAKERLHSLGFETVYHKKEDCYKVWDKLDFDVLLTNPPYSGDHMERMMKYVTVKRNAVWFLLAPQFLHKKDFYTNYTRLFNIQPFYLIPKKRYVYIPPKGFRKKNKLSETHKKSSPFNSMWYIYAGDQTQELITFFYKERGSSTMASCCDLARSRSALRDLRRKI